MTDGSMTAGISAHPRANALAEKCPGAPLQASKIQSPPASAPAAENTIRACQPGDISAVAQIFQNNFRDPRIPAPRSLGDYIEALFLGHPWFDREIQSQVYVDADGKLAGFIGVLPARFILDGQPVRGAFAGSLAVDNPTRNPLAGARLLRKFLSGPQDISISESANEVSIGMWERLGHKPLTAYSMDWLRVLRPAGFAVAAMSEWRRWAGHLAPLASLADRLGDRLAGNPLRPEFDGRGRVRDGDVDDDQFIDNVLHFAEQYSMRPAWDRAALGWTLSNAECKKRHGDTFKRVVYAKSGEPLGCYIYYGRPRGVAWVLQILSHPDASATVVESLINHAYRHGCVAVKGRSNPHINDALIRRKSVFFSHSSTVMHSKNQALLAAIRSDDALITGLAGENWTRLIGDRFS